MRKIVFQNDEYYHVYNRGVDKREVFCDEKDYLRFLRSIREFNNDSGHEQRDYEKRKEREKPPEKLSFGYPKLSFLEMPKLVEFVCYCFNPNHFHFLLKQLSDNGISKFMHKLTLGYVKYFNEKYSRSGSLFQGTFKSMHITSDDYLLQLSCYINGNAEIHKIANSENYPWSSYQDYLNKRNVTLCDKKIILDQFMDINEYKDLVNESVKNSVDIKEVMKKYILE